MMIEPEDFVFSMSRPTIDGYCVLKLRVESEEKNYQIFSNISEDTLQDTSSMNQIKKNMINDLKKHLTVNVKKAIYVKKELLKVNRIDHSKNGF
jgi:hypothetical protein